MLFLSAFRWGAYIEKKHRRKERALLSEISPDKRILLKSQNLFI